MAYIGLTLGVVALIIAGVVVSRRNKDNQEKENQ